MNRNQQRGIALVITLIMLSVVTITAVAFLAVTRQDRASVGAAAEQLDAQYAAETALQRAQSEIAGRILGSSNRFQIDLLVSTNWVNATLNIAQLQALANDSLDLRNANILTNATTYFRADGQPVFQLGSRCLAQG
jgi:Tfp pilus assembly protein PilX